MKYDDNAVLGLNWAGNVDVNVLYDWDPATHLKVPESDILGVETAIWSETPTTSAISSSCCSPGCRRGRARLDRASGPPLGRLPRAPRGPGAPLVGARHQRVPGRRRLTGSANPPSATEAAESFRHGDTEGTKVSPQSTENTETRRVSPRRHKNTEIFCGRPEPRSTRSGGGVAVAPRSE